MRSTDAEHGPDYQCFQTCHGCTRRGVAGCPRSGLFFIAFPFYSKSHKKTRPETPPLCAILGSSRHREIDGFELILVFPARERPVGVRSGRGPGSDYS